MKRIKGAFGGAIILHFVICLEILIMISPFAGFFYSAFNPFLLELAKNPATKWLSAFFFVHLVVPPSDFLKLVRVLGSVLFVVGLLAFLVCALQVYASKFLKTGPALKGLYTILRHPQYLSLAVAGIGLAIMWPRFLVVILWIAMVVVYYFLAKDEERRMLKQFPGPYAEYVDRSGMFLPKRIERALGFATTGGRCALFIVISALALGGAFLLRDYTVSRLPLWRDGNIVVLPISSGDAFMLEHRMSDILQLDEAQSRLRAGQVYLVYFLPQDYIMQGLIGDTGGDWQLYKRHHTISMITDFVIHPFGHLEGGHHAMHGAAPSEGHTSESATVRRLLFVRIPNETANHPTDLFAINAVRIPEFMIDVNIHTLEVLEVKSLPEETAWGRVPTPVF